MDSIMNDSGQRLVVNFQAVAWNCLKVAFESPKKSYPSPGLVNRKRSPIHITLLGAGAVGGYAIRATVRYWNDHLRERLAAANVPGFQVTVVDYDLTNQTSIMREIFRRTDILVDATQRPDPLKAVWI